MPIAAIPEFLSKNIHYINLFISVLPAALVAIYEYSKPDANKRAYVLIISLIVLGYFSSIVAKYFDDVTSKQKENIQKNKTDTLISNLKHQNEVLQLQKENERLNHTIVLSRFDTSDQQQLRTIEGVSKNLKLSAKSLSLQLDAVNNLTGGDSYPKVEFAWDGKEKTGAGEMTKFQVFLTNQGRYAIPSLKTLYVRAENCQSNKESEAFPEGVYVDLVAKYLTPFKNDSVLNPNNYHPVGELMLYENDSVVCVRIIMTAKNNIFEQTTKFVKRDLGRGFYIFEYATIIQDYHSKIYYYSKSPEYPQEKGGKITWENDIYGKPTFRY